MIAVLILCLQIDILFINHEESRTGAPRIVFDVADDIKNRKKVAIELNGKIIPQNKYDKKKIKDNDKIEIVQFIGGG